MKKFDEIFAQRGEQVQPENMVVGGYYFNVDGSYPRHNSIFTVAQESQEGVIFEDSLIFNNGNFYSNALPTPGTIRWDDFWDSFYEATPDQIELLNSYRPRNGTTGEKPAAL